MHILVEIQANNHPRRSDNERRNLPGVHALLPPHRAVALLLSACVTNGSTESGDPKADAVSVCQNVFHPCSNIGNNSRPVFCMPRRIVRGETDERGRRSFEFREIITATISLVVLLFVTASSKTV